MSKNKLQKRIFSVEKVNYSAEGPQCLDLCYLRDEKYVCVCYCHPSVLSLLTPGRCPSCAHPTEQILFASILINTAAYTGHVTLCALPLSLFLHFKSIFLHLTSAQLQWLRVGLLLDTVSKRILHRWRRSTDAPAAALLTCCFCCAVCLNIV